MQKCVIYTRFSPRRNAENCESCSIQIENCKVYAKNHYFQIRAVFDDPDVSGSDEFRPRLWDAIDTLKKGDVLLCWKRDRLARDLYLMCAIRRAVSKKGGTIHTVDQGEMGVSPEDVFRDQIIDAVAELERKTIASRTRSSMIRHQLNGRKMSAKIPYGWKSDPQNPKRIVPNEVEAAAVKQMLELRNAGHSFAKIASEIDQSASRVGHWHPNVVMNVIKHAIRDSI